MNTDHPGFESFARMIELAPDEPAMPAVVKPAERVATISSLQIAEITGKPHYNVTADIARILAEGEIDAQEFLCIYRDAQNREQKCYHLPRRECDLVVSGYSVKYRLAIIDRWQELERRQSWDFVQNDPASLRGLLLDNVEKVLALEATVSELTPKAEALARIAETDGLLNITNAAKVLQMRPKDLFTWLDCHGWTYRRPGNDERVPYQSKIQQGFMVMKAHHGINAVTGDAFVKERALITPKGLSKLAERVERRVA